MSGGSGIGDAERLAQAHRALRADASIQFDFAPVVPPTPPPAWVASLDRFLARIFGPVGRLLGRVLSLFPDGLWPSVLMWVVLGSLLFALLWMVATRLREERWRLPRRRRVIQLAAENAEPEPDWWPDTARARALLREADALAVDGRYAEAVHLLLLRGVEDIAKRCPALSRPALTSRDLAAADAIPPVPRKLFAAIARLVERSLFGGRALGAAEWGEARSAYANFALPLTWSAAA